MVSSAHPLATEAGIEILDGGGNAFDAAIAVAATLNVVEPMMSGIGGYGTVLVYDAEEGRTRFLNTSGRIPAAVNSDVYRAPTPNYEENRRGAKAVSTPGNANAWQAMHHEYGISDWRELFDPAIELALAGFVIGERTAGMIERAYDRFPDHAKEFYGVDGRPLQAGERLIQGELARSLRLIAQQGAGVVHGGELGRAIDQAMKDAGGFLSLQDEWWEPIAIDYRGHEILTASPPANAFPALVRLGMMSRFDPRSLGHNSASYLHDYAEVTKHAFWTRLRYAGDPDVSPPPLEMLLSEAYWEEQASLIDPARAKPFEPPTAFTSGDSHTTHFVVADRWGNVVSATQTLGNLFGSRIMPPGNLAQQLARLLHVRAEGQSHGRARGPAQAVGRCAGHRDEGREAVDRARDAGRTHDRPDGASDADEHDRLRHGYVGGARGRPDQLHRAGYHRDGG
jgi:gamma-glutamyltranspeptidase/glutathione hydrolase